MGKARKVQNLGGVEQELRAMDQRIRTPAMPVLDRDPGNPLHGAVWLLRTPEGPLILSVRDGNRTVRVGAISESPGATGILGRANNDPVVGPPRPQISFIAGSGINIQVADDAATGEIDVTISNTAPGGGGGGGGGDPPVCPMINSLIALPGPALVAVLWAENNGAPLSPEQGYLFEYFLEPIPGQPVVQFPNVFEVRMGAPQGSAGPDHGIVRTLASPIAICNLYWTYDPPLGATTQFIFILRVRVVGCPQEFTFGPIVFSGTP